MSRDQDGKPLPGLATVAKQQGRYVGDLIARRLAGKTAPAPFRYRDLGSLAIIGRSAAVADFGWLRLKGLPAWLTWGGVHLLLLHGHAQSCCGLCHLDLVLVDLGPRRAADHGSQRLAPRAVGFFSAPARCSDALTAAGLSTRGQATGLNRSCR